MLSVLVSWIIIFGISIILGYGFIYFIYKSSRSWLEQIDIYTVSGLMILNVYAEIFSLLYKVGAKACLGLAVLGIALLLYYYVAKRVEFRKKIKENKISVYQFLIATIIVIAVMTWTVGYPQHYDTSLYHYQAIKWIEEYGVVPGLGNLHNRFAYNSAFMALQALFSFEWLVGQSLHTVNGFVCCFFMIYAVISNRIWKLGEKIEVSDLLKVATVIYICYYKNLISSPSSDTLTLLLILYICTKWSEFIERDIKEMEPYGFLCILSAYAISLKLSAAACMVLVLWPAMQMIKRKKYKMIIKHLALGIIVLAPWLVRNVVISGYLLYPYPQLDIFDVDWKMPASVLTHDSREVIVWGRNVFNVEDYAMPIWKWFSEWFMNNSPVLISIGLIAEGLVLISLIKKLITKKMDLRLDMIAIYSFVSLVFWISSAPLMRYGMVYLMIPICLCISRCLNGKRALYEILLMLIIPTVASFLGNICNIGEKPYIWQEDYVWKLTEKVELENGISVWFPAEGDQCSADVFPCVPYRNMVERLELRGQGFENGFRIKEEYRELHIQGDGNEW